MKLREKFFKECTDPSINSGKDAGLRKINMTPHDLFEWFKNNMQGQSLPIDGVSNSFNVSTYTLIKKDTPNYNHWSKGLKMTILKNGVKLKLESDEIKELVNQLPRTFGGSY